MRATDACELVCDQCTCGMSSVCVDVFIIT
jgi:hypothetical protein